MTAPPGTPPPTLLARFAADPATVDDVAAASVEAHLIACADCRPGPGRRRRPGASVSDQLGRRRRPDRPAPAPPSPSGCSRRLGMDSGLARLVAATPGLAAPWLAAVVIVAAGAAWLSPHGRRGRAVPRARPPRPAGRRWPLPFSPARRPGGEAGVATAAATAPGWSCAGRSPSSPSRSCSLGAGRARPARALGRRRRRGCCPRLALAARQPGPGHLGAGRGRRRPLAGLWLARRLVRRGGSTAATCRSPTPPPSPPAASSLPWPPPLAAGAVLTARRDRFATLEARDDRPHPDRDRRRAAQALRRHRRPGRRRRRRSRRASTGCSAPTAPARPRCCASWPPCSPADDGTRRRARAPTRPPPTGASPSAAGSATCPRSPASTATSPPSSSSTTWPS